MQPDGDSLARWFQTPLGERLLEREQAWYDAELADVFGFNALQLGLAKFDFLRANRIPMRARVALDGPMQLRADVAELPIASGEVDLVVLPHTLEFSPNPHQVLRETQRILRPEGHVLISCFNPWSLWGLARLFRGRSGDYPWCGQFIGLPRIKDWLALLGFDSVAGRMTAYTPPLRGEQWQQRLRFMEPAGDRWWPFAGGVYFLHGIKRVSGIRLITPRWKMATARKKILAPVPHRLSDNRCEPPRGAPHHRVSEDR